ncbi:MAG: hypothetical protein QM727_04220 [Niabella sp.]
MQWKAITSGLGKSAYGLWINGRKMLTLVYKDAPDTMYLETEEGDKRLFHYRKRGIFKNKIVIENEYGVQLGHFRKDGDAEYIETDDKRYYLRYDNHHQTVDIIEEYKQEPVASCTIEDFSNEAVNQSLLMVMCLYLQKAFIDRPVAELAI